MKYSRSLAILLSSWLLSSAASAAPEAYPDGHGGEVSFPMGDVSFADTVVSYFHGDPSPIERRSNPAAALGIPDYADSDDGGYVSLGCAGELVLRFEDNALVDVAGPDLYVFEFGPDVEPTALAVSEDGEAWVRVGRVSGGQAEIDLAPYTPKGKEFRYVKLVDLKSGCDARETPGADIDAVGAIGSAQRISLDSAVLFGSGEYTLRSEASAAIDEVLGQITDRAATSVIVAGHTDAVGSARDNEDLSRNRARAVVDYLVGEAGFSRDRVTLEAHGESLPVASNETARGRARNRRVELTVSAPATDSRASGTDSIDILGVWSSERHGVLELRRTEGVLTGSYTSDGGRLVGEFISDTVFEGYWVENDSRRACDSEKAGSDHWGPLRLEFASPERDTFDSQWRYCGEEEWRGAWSSGERLL